MKRINLFSAFLFITCFSGGISAQTASAPRADTQIWNDTELAIPLNKKVDLLLTGTVRIGRNVTHLVDERAEVGFDIKANEYLSFTPSYLYQAEQPFAGSKSYEHRLRLSGTVKFSIGKFKISDRNMIERRLRNSNSDSTRYRNRLQIEHPVSLKAVKFNVFVADEVYYDWSLDGWVRNRFYVGANKEFSKRFTGSIYYLRQNDGTTRPGDLHVIGTTVRLNF